MAHQFDPMVLRKRYRDRLLSALEKDDVTLVPVLARNHFSRLLVGDLVEAYLVGLAGQVQEILGRQLAGMLSVPEPERSQFHHSPRGEELWCEELYQWRQALGLCKWLAGEPAEREFTASLAADWQGLQTLAASDALDAGIERRRDITIRLATALAADTPRLGLEIFQLCKVPEHYVAKAPILGFGVRACHQLMTGGQRDAGFLATGKQALAASLLPVLLPNVRRIEIALWLKAIFFDSGAAKTAEEAMMLAYECMPGVRRPDFMSAHATR